MQNITGTHLSSISDLCEVPSRSPDDTKRPNQLKVEVSAAVPPDHRETMRILNLTTLLYIVKMK